MAKSMVQKKDINVPHAELGHPSEVITPANGRAVDLHLIGTFNHCEDCTLGKAKKSGVIKRAFESSKILDRDYSLI